MKRNKKTVLETLLGELGEGANRKIELQWLGHAETQPDTILPVDADFLKPNLDRFEKPIRRTFTLSEIGDYWEDSESTTAFQYGFQILIAAIPYDQFQKAISDPD